MSTYSESTDQWKVGFSTGIDFAVDTIRRAIISSSEGAEILGVGIACDMLLERFGLKP